MPTVHSSRIILPYKTVKDICIFAWKSDHNGIRGNAASIAGSASFNPFGILILSTALYHRECFLQIEKHSCWYFNPTSFLQLRADAMNNLFFNDWESLIRVFIQTILAYLCMIVLLRITGKRTLAKMNAFDFVITIALGSTLATMALNKNVAVTEGALAIFLLIGMQYLITWLSVRKRVVKNLVTSQPRMLLYRGEILDHSMRKERVTREELNLAARSSGAATLREIDIIILETTGKITVIPRFQSTDKDTLEDVNKPED